MPSLWDSPEFAHWLVSKRLGRGGMGEVYLAEDRMNGSLRAVKIVRPDLATAHPGADVLFAREMRISQSLIHQNVVRCYGTGTVGDIYYILMEFCELGSLADIVTSSGPLSVEESIRLFIGILDGLNYAHKTPVEEWDADGNLIPAIGIVHRDIKPQNILLARGQNDEPIAKLGDFGLAKAFETAGLSGLTKTGMASGTPSFMPREQVLNYKYARPDVDVWAVAASLYFALTGATPRDFPSGRDPWLTVCTEPAKPIRSRGVHVPPGLASLLDQALKDDMGLPLAYHAAADFKAALANVPI